ncbi:MAG TPA: CotH kinase family protein [Polyangiaceae bacterium]
MLKRFAGLAMLLATACGESKDDEASPVESGGSAGVPTVGTTTSAPTSGAGGTSTRSDSSFAGIRANGGTSATSSSTSDLVEKGLCSITVGCTQPIVDDPPVACTFDVRDATGTAVFSDHAGVELRGRSSMNFPKKNYGIELHDASGADNPANLLGMGKESDWVLDGAWADRSFMRNRVSFSLFRDMAPTYWAPRARYCELTLNQKYQGIYVLLEKIKRDDDRVVLPDDDGTGSTFIVKQDDNGTLKLTIGNGAKWKVVYPGSSIITDKQTQAVQAFLDRLGTALNSSSPSDLLTLFDTARVIDWILLEEFAKNVDAYNLSLFFARSSGGAAWPIPWDLDLAYGQPTIRNFTGNETAEGWVHNRTNFISKLSTLDAIRQGLGPRWRALRLGVFSEASILKRLDDYLAVLTEAARDANFKLWPIENVDFTQIYAPYTFYDVTNYSDELAHLRTWIQQRLVWLDANIDSYPSK